MAAPNRTDSGRSNAVELKKFVSSGVRMNVTSISATQLVPEAELPSKEETHQAAWELTIVSRCDGRAEDETNNVNTFSTGLVLNPPRHFHLEITGHPQLWKTGYTFVDGPLIINHSEDGGEELVIPLLKYREAEDIDIPFRAVVMILRETQHSTVVATKAATTRGGGRAPSRRSEYDEDYDDRAAATAVPARRGARGGGGGATPAGRGSGRGKRSMMF